MSKIRCKRKADIRQKLLRLNQRVSSVMCQVSEEIIKTIEIPEVSSNKSHEVAAISQSDADEHVDQNSFINTNTEVLSQLESKENEVSEEFSHTKICNDSSPKTQESLLQERILPNFKGRTNINVGQSFQSYNTYPSVF